MVTYPLGKLYVTSPGHWIFVKGEMALFDVTSKHGNYAHEIARVVSLTIRESTDKPSFSDITCCIDVRCFNTNRGFPFITI